MQNYKRRMYMNNLKLILIAVGAVVVVGTLGVIGFKQLKSCLAKNNNMSNAEL
jgi:hypothetical protein